MKNSTKALLFAKFIITLRNENNTIDTQRFVDENDIDLHILYDAVLSEGKRCLNEIAKYYNIMGKSESTANYYGYSLEEVEIVLEAETYLTKLSCNQMSVAC